MHRIHQFSFLIGPQIDSNQTTVRNLRCFQCIAVVALVILVGACVSGDDPVANDSNTEEPNGADIVDDTDTSDIDTGNDAEEDVDPCPVCCPGDVRCSLSTDAVETCTEDGLGFEETRSCNDDEICEDAQCIDEPVCVPDEQMCGSSNSLLICRATGDGYFSEDCPDGQACYNDECISGSATGATCEENDDCVGGKCRCGDDESCSFEHQPYCTSDCSSSTCSGDQICWQRGNSNENGYDHCLAPCGGDNCGLTECESVLIEDDGELRWEDACVPDGLKAVGELCDSDAECASEICEEDYFGFGYCTRRCEVGGCPDGQACVDQEGNGDFWCFPECDGAEQDNCPFPGFSISCRNRTTYEGSGAEICY